MIPSDTSTRVLEPKRSSLTSKAFVFVNSNGEPSVLGVARIHSGLVKAIPIAAQTIPKNAELIA